MPIITKSGHHRKPGIQVKLKMPVNKKSRVSKQNTIMTAIVPVVIEKQIFHGIWKQRYGISRQQQQQVRGISIAQDQGKVKHKKGQVENILYTRGVTSFLNSGLH